MNTRMYVCIYLRVYIYICMYIYIYIYIYVHVCVCVCECEHISILSQLGCQYFLKIQIC